MTDFQSFRNAVLEDDDLQEAVISIINTATANGSGLGDGITTLAKTHGFTITSDEVYAHQDFLGLALCRCLPRKHSSSTIRASNFVFIAYPNEDL